MSEKRKYMTCAEVASRFGVTAATIRNMVRRGCFTTLEFDCGAEESDWNRREIRIDAESVALWELRHIRPAAV